MYVISPSTIVAATLLCMFMVWRVAPLKGYVGAGVP